MQRQSAGAQSAPAEAKPVSADAVIAAVKQHTDKNILDSITIIENKLSATTDNAQMVVALSELSGIWQRHKKGNIANYYKAKIAKLENSEKDLTFAGSLFMQLMENEGSPSVQMWEAGEAVDCFERALKIDSSNEDIKLKLATVYLDGTGQPMNGVRLLLGIVSEKPDDIAANLLLGKMSIKSGQYDKAMVRLQTVLKQEPENTEALYFMAQVYKEKGDKKKAIELFEQCKKLVNRPEFSREVDQYINSFK